MGNKGIVIGTITFSIIIIVGSYFIFSGSNEQSVKIASYSVSDVEKPQVAVTQTRKDLGTMKVSDQKSAEFVIKNSGKKPLQLSEITTSCGCTVAQVIYEGKESREFGMHSKNNYVAEIASQKEAKVKVTYRPYVMPVYGAVEREAYLTTNDPLKPKLVLIVAANVK